MTKDTTQMTISRILLTLVVNSVIIIYLYGKEFGLPYHIG